MKEKLFKIQKIDFLLQTHLLITWSFIAFISIQYVQYFDVWICMLMHYVNGCDPRFQKIRFLTIVILVENKFNIVQLKHFIEPVRWSRENKLWI